MEIKVQGIGEKKFKPDMIKFVFNFNVKRKKYDTCLTDGAKTVDDYFRYLMSKGFKKQDIKTDRFNIRRESVYNESTRKYDEGDFAYSFSCSLIMDYDLEIMSQIVEETSRMKECPTYKIDFGIKNEKKALDELMALAYKHAENQAEIIAKASGKKLKDCVKVSFEPFDETTTRSYDHMEMMSSRGMAKESVGSTRDSIQNIFVPEDVELDFTLYTLWITE